MPESKTAVIMDILKTLAQYKMETEAAKEKMDILIARTQYHTMEIEAFKEKVEEMAKQAQALLRENLTMPVEAYEPEFEDCVSSLRTQFTPLDKLPE